LKPLRIGHRRQCHRLHAASPGLKAGRGLKREKDLHYRAVLQSGIARPQGRARIETFVTLWV